MITTYFFGIICGIAILFLLKFMQVLNSELHGFGTARATFNPTRGNMLQTQKNNESPSPSRRSTYAVPQDFCRIFAEDTTPLFLLSLALTADPEKAEKCFVAGLDDSIHGNPVFKEWARSWSKRTIIKNAIRMISPAPGRMNGKRAVPAQKILELDPRAVGFLTPVRGLAPFERFVFVMLVLEGYSTQECSILLNCTKQEVLWGRARALQQLAAAGRNIRSQATDDSRSAHFLESARIA